MPSSKFWKKAAATRNSYSNGGDNLMPGENTHIKKVIYRLV
jgi:hypothetical protein